MNNCLIDFQSKYGGKLYEILKKMLIFNHKYRSDFRDLLNHMKKMNKKPENGYEAFDKISEIIINRKCPNKTNRVIWAERLAYLMRINKYDYYWEGSAEYDNGYSLGYGQCGNRLKNYNHMHHMLLC